MNSYTFHINFYDLAFLGAIFIGLAFALLLWFVKTVNRSANRFLALALVTMTLWMMRILAIDIRLETYLPRWDWLPMQFLLALGPLMYFYVLKITNPQYKYSWKSLLHFSPLLLEQAALVLQMKESAKTGAVTYATHAFQQFNPVLQLLIFISIITYLHLCDKLIQKFYRRLQPVLMDRPLLEFRWLRRLLAATALLWLLWIFCAAVYYFGYHNQSSLHVYYPFYIFFVVIIIWTAMAAFLKPQAAVMVQTEVPVRPPVPAELKAKGAWLKRAMDANLYYQDPELSLSSLAEKLGLHPHELSRVINTALKKNFNDFVNEYRVREIISKMNNPAYDNMTLLGIGTDAGFRSKSTFNRTFKQMTGNSPVEYKNTLKNRLPSYHLTPYLTAHPYSAAVVLFQQAIPKWSSEKLNRNFMFKNYFKTAWRDITRNKVYSSLNICGLAIGMAVALLIGLWIVDQCSYDRFTRDYQQAYQVKYNFSNNGVVETTTDVAIPLAAALKNDVPEIAYTATAYGPAPYGNQTNILQVGEKKISPVDMVADKDFLKIIRFPVLEGNADSALNNPDDVVITESVAKALFGDVSAIGKTILINHWHNTKVTAVLKDLPHNSTLRFGFITSFSDFARGWARTSVTNWNLNLYKVYASLKPNVTFAQVAPKIKGIVQKYAPATYKSFGQQVTMQPMQDWNLYTQYKNGIAVGGPIEYVWMFGVIGILVLVIACINFMNLSTARSAKRAKEVGIRKVVGSSTGRLVVQFLLESVLMSALAFMLCLLTIYMVLPSFNTLAGTSIVIPFSSGLFWLLMLSYIIFTGLLAGSRPAFYLSGMQPVKVLKGKIATGGAASQLRRVLVVLQFTCSIALISATVVVYQQIEYARNRPRGYDPNRLVISEAGGVRYADLKHEVMETGVVSNFTQCLSPVTDVYSSHDMIDNWPGKQPGEVFTPAANAIGDTDYFKTVGIQFVLGHNFTGNQGTDSNGVILNEAAVRHMRLKQPLNQTISWSLSWVPDNMRVIGVVKDVVSSAPFARPEPAIYIYQPGWSFTVMYRLSPQVGTQAALQKLAPIFNKYRPDYPFQYHFADENYAAKFGQEQLVGKLAGIFAALAIFISCLGLFGLAAYMAEQRTKEIGIRKVLGASVPQVVMLIAKDFVVLVGISCIIASPVAFYFLQQWLNGYYYRIHIGPGVFIASGAMAITITIVTISFQAFKAAFMNPVKSLRTE